MDTGRRSPARLLAPIALVGFTLALLAVIAGSVGSDDGDGDGGGGGGNGAPAAQQDSERPDAEEDTTAPDDSDLPRFYTVQTGDTLAGIAEEFGLSVERLQELNPELDPQALVSGQRIRLRE